MVLPNAIDLQPPSVEDKEAGVCMPQDEFEEYGWDNHIGAWTQLIDRIWPLRLFV